MTAAIDAINAAELLGGKFLGQMPSRRQKQESQQVAAHRHANEHHTVWSAPFSVAGVSDKIEGSAGLVRYFSHNPLPIAVLKNTSESYRPIDDPYVILFSGGQLGVVAAGVSRARADNFWPTTVLDSPSASIASRIISEIEALRDGWDGPGTVAPSALAKKTANSVVAQAAPFLSLAEIEVDPTVGNPGFHWFSDDQQSVVSLTIQQRGGVVIVASSTSGTSYRVSFSEAELDKVGRALVDAGVGRLNGALR